MDVSPLLDPSAPDWSSYQAMKTWPAQASMSYDTRSSYFTKTLLLNAQTSSGNLVLYSLRMLRLQACYGKKSLVS